MNNGLTHEELVLADALCNLQPRDAEGLNLHARKRYRGIAGVNGVGCDECRTQAKLLSAEVARINASVDKMRAEGFIK